MFKLVLGFQMFCDVCHSHLMTGPMPGVFDSPCIAKEHAKKKGWQVATYLGDTVLEYQKYVCPECYKQYERDAENAEPYYPLECWLLESDEEQMTTRVFSKDFLLDVLEIGQPNSEHVVHHEFFSRDDQIVTYEIIFKHEDKYYRVYLDEPTTEAHFECTEVKKAQKVVEAWLPIDEYDNYQRAGANLDVLAAHALEEYKAGQTYTLQDMIEGLGIDIE